MKIIVIIALAILITYTSSTDNNTDLHINNKTYFEAESVNRLIISNLTEIRYPKKEYVLDSDLQEVLFQIIQDWNEVETLTNRTKIAACIILVRNSLAVGNKDVSATLEDTKHDQSKTFEKILALMYERCFKTIPHDVISKVMEPNKFSAWEESYNEYVKFQKNIFQIIGPELKFTDSEKFILNQIAEVT